MLVGVLTLGVLTTATMVGIAAQPSAVRARPMMLVQPAMPTTAPLTAVVDLHVARAPRGKAADDLFMTSEDPLIASKRRAFAENGRNCHVIGGQRCLSRPRALLTLR
ncbi:hypothetical protein [Sphingomonas aracearum]|uniref:Uncharacterized protein n=1 Tax=Sphingomonas aracearum TaxID=2283317 RepID=A0A369VZ04_9SPHN|nr:hypothetical protein [Sphingomonas aracearum]RDE07039.1 hypothetical protein DVW87_05120 [Sphingomonas aracearum]